jgi:hypothetical protein
MWVSLRRISPAWRSNVAKTIAPSGFRLDMSVKAVGVFFVVFGVEPIPGPFTRF